MELIDKNEAIKVLRDTPCGSAGIKARMVGRIEKMPTVDVLEQIRAELHATAEMHEDGDYYLRDEWIDEYFDKHIGTGS